MADLLQSQIVDSCRLALPEGLKELMSDISREVLRSQPENLYQFIADYLAALLDARQALSIACRICGDVCKCACEPDLDYDLRCIGLSDEDAVKAKNIIQEHFDKGQVKESRLLIKLAKKTSVTETQLAELQVAVQRAYQRHLLKHRDHQVSFANMGEAEDTETTHETSVSTPSGASDFYKPAFMSKSDSTLDDQSKEPKLIYHYQPCKMTESATTLAGSYIHLPDRVPYSVHDTDPNIQLLNKEGFSVLNVLQSLLYHQTHEGNENEVTGNRENINTLHTLPSQELMSQCRHSEEIDDTIKRIVRDDVSVLSKVSLEQDVASFKMEPGTSEDNSSGSDHIA